MKEGIKGCVCGDCIYAFEANDEGIAFCGNEDSPSFGMEVYYAIDSCDFGRVDIGELT